jgi:Capsule assembly protein Wzi
MGATSTAFARGVSPYLPLELSPEMERDIERVLIYADRTVMTRPIPTAVVLDALPATCKTEQYLCSRVRRYLDRYMRTLGIDDASAAGAGVDGAQVARPNARGMTTDSSWRVSASGHWQPGDYLLVSLGGVAYDDEAVASGSMVSVGFEYAQLDMGYRDHWLSPFTHSAMLMSTQAKTLPSITLSNYAPISRFGVGYEVFLAEMDFSDRILFADEDGFTSGRPRLAGVRFAIEPAAGWSLGVARVFQFGGGERGGDSFGDFFEALFNPSTDNSVSDQQRNDEFGNQLAAWTSRFIFPGRTPFSAYLEYAGEDRSYEGNYRLGNAALSIGITWPLLAERFDLTYEFSEWQNDWYVNAIYGDGYTNDGHVLGHWGADQRMFGDPVGAQTHMLRVGWEPPFGGLLTLQARTVANEDYSAVDYERGYDVTASYARAVRGVTVGAEVILGEDVFGDSFGRLAGFFRLAGAGSGGGLALRPERSRPRGADLFVDAGVNASEVQIRLGDGSPTTTTDLTIAPHLAIGARRAVSERSDLGVRLELDDIDGELLLSVRALDYRYRFRGPLAISFFMGASRYDLATPAYGYYLGAGVQWRDLLDGFDVGFDLRYSDKVARDKLLPSDPPKTPREDAFYDISGAALSLSYRF